MKEMPWQIWSSEKDAEVPEGLTPSGNAGAGGGGGVNGGRGGVSGGVGGEGGSGGIEGGRCSAQIWQQVV
jgi:hypothetical protein